MNTKISTYQKLLPESKINTIGYREKSERTCLEGGLHRYQPFYKLIRLPSTIREDKVRENSVEGFALGLSARPLKRNEMRHQISLQYTNQHAHRTVQYSQIRSDRTRPAKLAPDQHGSNSMQLDHPKAARSGQHALSSLACSIQLGTVPSDQHASTDQLSAQATNPSRCRSDPSKHASTDQLSAQATNPSRCRSDPSKLINPLISPV
ncbi:hypothetical protein F511_38952 [Dorcoceras hygrometricum]|uniref:Uncharacterized protein n=1 Tax=Dorcoceras hygrometricum TaxID=472368 RepID=A0A2Z7DDU0_9LAMI|nr:hypothetical protein F511_38952 [Dorcoceras hygrometricum]